MVKGYSWPASIRIWETIIDGDASPMTSFKWGIYPRDINGTEGNCEGRLQIDAPLVEVQLPMYDTSDGEVDITLLDPLDARTSLPDNTNSKHGLSCIVEEPDDEIFHTLSRSLNPGRPKHGSACLMQLDGKVEILYLGVEEWELNQVFLVLAPSEKAAGCYQRIGIFEGKLTVDGTACSWSKTAHLHERQTFTII